MSDENTCFKVFSFGVRGVCFKLTVTLLPCVFV